jgi:hypothetical protein
MPCIKVKVKHTTEKATKAQRWCRGIALLFNLSASWRWVVNTMPQLLYLWERSTTCCIRSWVCPRPSLEGCGKSRPPWGFDPQTVQPAASHYIDRTQQYKLWNIYYLPHHKHHYHLQLNSTHYIIYYALFNLYLDEVIRIWLQKLKLSKYFKELIFSTLLFADDQFIVCDTEDNLQKAVYLLYSTVEP